MKSRSMVYETLKFRLIISLSKILIVFAMTYAWLLPTTVYAQAENLIDREQRFARQEVMTCFHVIDGVPTIKGLECVFANVLRVSLSLFGLAVFVVIIIGSMQLLLSGGDPQKAEKAKSTIGWGAGGLAAALGVWFLLLFISNFTGAGGLLDFSITIFGQ